MSGTTYAVVDAQHANDLLYALVKLAEAVETRKPAHEGYLNMCAEEARALIAKFMQVAA